MDSSEPALLSSERSPTPSRLPTLLLFCFGVSLCALLFFQGQRLNHLETQVEQLRDERMKSLSRRYERAKTLEKEFVENNDEAEEDPRLATIRENVNALGRELEAASEAKN